MYSVKIRSHVMIAHSLSDSFFGKAQNLHGVSYITDISFFTEKLDSHNVVIDIDFAHQIVKEVLAELHYHNLDNMPGFFGYLTTTEFLAKFIHDQVKEKVRGTFSGRIHVTLGESHIAWVTYEGELF